MINKPQVSIVMTVYNTGKYLYETIESLLNQTFKDFELIIVNDKSTDDSLEKIREYMKRDNRIVLINNKKNMGPTTSLNIGLEHAKGKYIAISDHDDISLPKRLEVEYTFLENNKGIFLVGGGAVNINESGKKLSTFRPILNPNKIKRVLPNKNCFYHPTIMYRNEKGVKYREKILYAHDRDFYLNLLSQGKILANLSSILIKYRTHSNQLSVSKSVKQFLFSEKAKEFYRQRERYGKDEYDLFDNKTILNLDLSKNNSPLFLKKEIFGHFISENYNLSRILSKEYISKYGFFNKIGIYFILSFLGERYSFFCIIIRWLRRIFSNISNLINRIF